jgi:hypothetical protein
MTPINARFAIERRPMVVGLVAFLLLAFVLPLTTTILASLGPKECVTQYLAPARQFQPVLLVLVGAITGWQSLRSPISNALAVGFIGGLGLLLVAASIGASPHLGISAYIFQYVAATIAWCFIGGLSVSLLHSNRRAL